MKTKRNSFNPGVILILFLFCAPVCGGTFGSSANATVSVHIVRPLMIASSTDMSFNGLTPSETPGVVLFRQDGSRNATGGVFVESGSFFTPASFVAKGEPNGEFILTLPEFITMTDANGNTMTVDSFTRQSGKVVKFDKAGQKEMKVGARFHVNHKQASGHYRGELNILINYE